MTQEATHRQSHKTVKGVRLWPRTLREAARDAAAHLARYRFAERFVGGRSVCDVACGAGYGSGFLAKKAKKVIAMDISPEAVQWAGAHFAGDNIEFVVADAGKAWPLDDQFDVITSFETMEHLAEPEVFLGQVYNHLADLGVLVLSVPNGPRDKKRTDNPYHLQHFSDTELKAVINKYFARAEFFSQAYRKGLKHYATKALRKTKLLSKQPWFVDNYFLEPGLCESAKTWVVIAYKQA